VDELVLEIAEGDGIEGVTILGGEPLEQPDSVLAVIQAVKEKGLTVMLYTGYEEEELRGAQRECVSFSDIVIMGRYVASLRDTNLRWRGSANQEIRVVSDAYDGLVVEERGEVEITVEPDGGVSMAGYPERWLLKVLEGL
jgi:anaerobic ribonucleoside-triphosphate reductase activating protein